MENICFMPIKKVKLYFLKSKQFFNRITGEWGLETGGGGGDDPKPWALGAEKAGATKQWSIDSDSIVMCNSVTISSRYNGKYLLCTNTLFTASPNKAWTMQLPKSCIANITSCFRGTLQL